LEYLNQYLKLMLQSKTFIHTSKGLFKIALLISILFVGCKKDNDSKLTVQETKSLNKKANNANTSSADILVMDNNYEIVYLGAILSGTDILSESTFNPLGSYAKLPIKVSTSISGAPSATINPPRLSTYRQTVQDILRSTTLSNPDIASFLYYYRPFYDYKEITREFGYKVNTRGLFSKTSSSLTNQLTTITKKYGFVSAFELVNFTVDMSSPKLTELIDTAAAHRLVASGENPVYINSISYGQKGVLAVETDYNMEQTTKIFEKLTKKIFKKTKETFSSTEINIINNSTIRLFLVGGSSGGSSVTIDGYNGFINYVKDIGAFSADNPGYPISFRCRKLKDFSLFKALENE